MTQCDASILPAIQSIRVPDEELARLMGWPRRKPFDPPTAALVDEARHAFAEHARPWMHLREEPIREIDDDRVVLRGDEVLTNAKLAQHLSAAQAHAVAVFASTAGAEVETEIDRLWAADRPDLSFALSATACAFVEQMLLRTHESLCGWADSQHIAAMHAMSPGNDGWDLADQHVLHRLIAADIVAPLRVLDSGALVPSRSQLAVFGLTSQTELLATDDMLSPCTRCSLRGCVYRRAGYESSPAAVGRAAA